MNLFKWIKSWFVRESVPAVSGAYPNAAKHGVLVGLTKLNPKMYGGWDGDCPGCDKDLKAMTQLARSEGINCITLANEQAHRIGFKEALRKAGSDLVAGDLLFVYYSGHGGQLADNSGDELDGVDETLCLWDGQFRDDDLAHEFAQLAPGVRVLLITDSCHSGSVSRSAAAPPVLSGSKIKAVYHEFPHVELIHIAGCADSRVSYGSMLGGAMTLALGSVYKSGHYTARQWFDAAKKRMPSNQIIQFEQLGASDKFQKSVVFE
jgi:hypothetical protein